MKCGTYLFADDTKIFQHITTKEDALQLQSDISSLAQWSQNWRLNFRPKTCYVQMLEKFCNVTYTEKCNLHRQELEHVFEQKDLGVILDAELKFDEHTSAKVKKANAIAGLIRRTFLYFDGPVFKKLFITFVRPHVKYGQVIWSPHLKKYITILENEQHQPTKLVDGFHHISCSERLKKQNLPSLVYKRARGDVIAIFKLHSTKPELRFIAGSNPARSVSEISDGEDL